MGGRVLYNGRTIDIGNYVNVYRPVTIVGRNSAVSTLADLWPPGSSISGAHSIQAAGITLAVSSTSTADAAAGTGARTVSALCVLANGTEIILTATLNGQTKVATFVDLNGVGGYSVVAVNLAWAATWGTGLTNAGKIEFYDTSDSVTGGENQTIGKRLAIIDTGDNWSRCGWYTVPDAPDGNKCDLLIYAMSFINMDNTTTVKYGAASYKVNFMSWMQQTFGAAGAANWFLFDAGQIASAVDPLQIPGPNVLEPLVIVKNGGVIDLQATLSAAAAVTGMAWGLLLY